MTLSSAGVLTLSAGGIVIPDTGTIGSASVTGAMSIAADGDVDVVNDFTAGTVAADTTISGTTITASTGFALGDGDYIGITSNEIITFNTAGTINISGASFDVDGAATATTYKADTSIETPYLIVNAAASAADAGAIRLANADNIAWEADEAGTDVVGMSVDSSEVVQIAPSGASGVTITPALTLSSTLTDGTATLNSGAWSGISTLAMTGAFSGATTISQTHTAPTFTMNDSNDDADGTANILFQSAGAYDITATIQTDVAGTPTTMITLDGVNSKVVITPALETTSDATVGGLLKMTTNTADYILYSDGTSYEETLLTTAMDDVIAAQKKWQCVSVSVAGMIADGTNATAPASEAINSGPNVWFSTVSDAAGTLEFSIPMPENWDGGNIYVEMIAGTNEGTPSGTVEFEVSAMARGNDDLINGTWVTGSNVQFADNIDTQYDVVVAESDVIAASGAGGDMLYILLTRDNDDETNDTSTQAVEVWGARVYYQIDDLDERD